MCEEENISDRFSSKKKTRKVVFDNKTIILSDAKEAKEKLAQLKREVSSKFKQIQIELDLGNDLQTSEDLLEQVEILKKILEDEGEFDKFLKSFVKAEENVDKGL